MRVFTGIIEEVGRVGGLRMIAQGAAITITCRRVLEGLREGDSIAVNGVCLTATEMGAGSFRADVSQESLERSNLGGLRRGSEVNLERALSLGDRLGGHIVQGHVDGVGNLKAVKGAGESRVLTFSVTREIAVYLVEKGSIAVNGISLTVSGLGEGEFSVAAIPHTIEKTNLKGIKAGDAVNLEVDIIAKYVRRYLERGMPAAVGGTAPGDALRDKLSEGGFM
ncbi:MAG: riboflavin synthase [Actinomycetota bacterium]